ncbi:MAG: hypothetical protein U5N86_05945 [Planctomycetota bacterium]|nr:hypothetical protein [Planctomycetota bacterium]
MHIRHSSKGLSLSKAVLVAIALLFVVAAGLSTYANIVVLNSAEGDIYSLERAPSANVCIVFGGGDMTADLPRCCEQGSKYGAFDAEDGQGPRSPDIR